MKQRGGDRWHARPWLAFATRAVIVGIPLLAGFATTILCAHLLRAQIAGTRWWLVVPAAASIAVCFGLERLTRRLLPLAALLKLALLFPDRAPSRFKIARHANSVRALRERLADEPTSDASTAAEAALALITALTSHDRRTRGHSERVRVFTDLLGEQLRLTRDAADRLRWASLLHDIGKLKVAVEILNKPSKLDAREWDVISAHPTNGEQLLGPLLEWLGEWGAAVRQHHEKYDGSGYPDGVSGTQISRAGRIVAIADAYEVMTAHRAYKKPMSTVAARTELARCAGTHFDPGYVRAFLAIPLPKLLWAMGPGSLLMNLPLLRMLAEAGNKGVIASSQTGVAAVSAAAVISGIGAANSLAATPADHPSAAGRVHQTAHHKQRRAAAPHDPAPAPAPSRAARPAPHRTPTATDPSPGETPSTTPPAPTPTPTPTPAPTDTPTPTPTDTPTGTPAPPVTTAPDAPTAATATPGDGQATVSWRAPANTGGAPLTGFTITPIGPAGAGTPVHADPDSSSAVVPGLVNGTGYHFSVVAENAIGSSPAVDTDAVVPAGVPTAPTGPDAIAGDGAVTLTWTAAGSNGSPLTTYTITPRTGGSALPPVVVNGTATTAVVDGLDDGTTYTFDIVAANRVGRSAAATTAPVMPIGAPGAPAAANANGGNSSATVSWSAAPDHGSPVTGYVIVPVGPSGALPPTTAAATDRSALVPGLANGTSYRFEVRALNALGASPARTTSPVVPADVPAAPTAVTASAGDGEATVFWTPADANGRAVTGYTVTPVGPGGPLAPISVPGSAVSASVPGLTNGTAYTFRVTATNALGTSAPGTGGPVTPVAAAPAASAPAAPGSPAAVAGLAEATISWTAPADGGSPITSYTITARRGATPAGSWQVAPDLTSYTVPGLTPGTAYSFTITADNAIGSSSPAGTGTVTPMSTPDAVGSVTAAAGDGRVTVSWTVPAADGGSPVTGYTVTPVGPTGPLAPVAVAAGRTSTTVTGLTNGTTYTFEVIATNRFGASPVTTSAAVTPAFALTPDVRYIVQGGTETMDVLRNDVGDLVPATVRVATAPMHGTATANADGTITYHPAGGYHGADWLIYQACDAAGDCGRATVWITVLQPDQHGTNFSGVDLHDADLTGVNFTGADLSGANLTGADLTKVNFTGADLTGADLSNADLTRANLHQATLDGADLTGANLTGANLDNATADRSTVLTGANLTGITGGPAPKVNGGTNLSVLGPKTLDLIAMTSDPNVPLDPASIVITKAPAHGTLVLHADGTATYTPNPFYLGGDSFSFRIANVFTMTGTGTVQITVL